MLNLLKNEKAQYGRKEKIMILLEDREIKKFKNFESAEEFLKKQKETDEWKRIPVKFLKVLSLPNNPICIKSIMVDNHITSSEEATLSAMGSTDLLLSYPANGNNAVIPVRNTGINSLKERAKLTGNALIKMPSEKKAITLNYGLELWNESALLLIRDEKISAVHAGDESDYSILPMHDLVKKLHGILESDYPGYKVNNIEVGHEITLAEITLSKDILNAFNQKLAKKGRKLIDGKPILKFASSDVGLCGANLYPYIKNGGIQFRIGNVLRLKHKNKSTISQFEDHCKEIFSIFKNADVMSKLLDIKIQYPKDCFLAVAKKCGLPKKPALEAAEEFDAFRPVECYAYDIYVGLWEVTRFINFDSETQLLNLEENISRAMHIDYSNYDHAFSWL